MSLSASFVSERNAPTGLVLFSNDRSEPSESSERLSKFSLGLIANYCSNIE